VTSGPIMYLIMEDQFLSRCHTAQLPASEFEDAGPAKTAHPFRVHPDTGGN